MRRAFVLALAALAVVVALPSSAQDSRSSAAQDAAREWLALADRIDGKGSWAAAGAEFHRTITEDRWRHSLEDARTPLGALTRRTVVSTHFTEHLKGMPKGEYAQIQFRSSFAQRDYATERLTLQQTAAGWKVIGYFIV